MKALLITMLAAAMLFICACSPAAPADGVGLANPIVDVENASAFEDIGITMEAPANAADAAYSIIAGEVAQIRFSLDGLSYTLRASASLSDEALHGVYDTFDDIEQGVEVDAADWHASVRVRTVDSGNGGALATWSYDPVNYSLYTADAADAESMGELAASIAGTVFPKA